MLYSYIMRLSYRSHSLLTATAATACCVVPRFASCMLYPIRRGPIVGGDGVRNDEGEGRCALCGRVPVHAARAEPHAGDGGEQGGELGAVAGAAEGGTGPRTTPHGGVL